MQGKFKKTLCNTRRHPLYAVRWVCLRAQLDLCCPGTASLMLTSRSHYKALALLPSLPDKLTISVFYGLMQAPLTIVMSALYLSRNVLGWWHAAWSARLKWRVPIPKN